MMTGATFPLASPGTVCGRCGAEDLQPGDVVLNWWPAFGVWERCEVLSLTPAAEATPSGRGLRMRNRYGELTEYLGNYEKRLGQGNRLLPKEPRYYGGMSGKIPQTWRYRRTS